MTRTKLVSVKVSGKSCKVCADCADRLRAEGEGVADAGATLSADGWLARPGGTPPLASGTRATLVPLLGRANSATCATCRLAFRLLSTVTEARVMEMAQALAYSETSKKDFIRTGTTKRLLVVGDKFEEFSRDKAE